MFSNGSKFALKTAEKAWWKILAKKTAETARKVAKNREAQELAKMAAEKGTDILIKKSLDRNGMSLEKRIKKLQKMHKKGILNETEYRQLKARIIENADVAEI